MTSIERKEKRYWRRKLRRSTKKSDFNRNYDNYEKVFSYDNLYSSYRSCRKGVSWKESVQKFIILAPLRVYYIYNGIVCRSFRSDGFYNFDINERGKIRHISSVSFRERVVQRCLCDYSLVPVLRRSLIYDNCASLKGRGQSFCDKRLVSHLVKCCKSFSENDTDRYVLSLDYSSFFESISHEVCKRIIYHNFKDENLVNFIVYFIDQFPGDKGLGLGSQISQILALSVLNKIDHLVKDEMSCRHYIRYMDDSLVIGESKNKAKKILSRVTSLSGDLGLKLNNDKTQVIKMSKEFTFIKVRYNLISNKILKRIKKKIVKQTKKRLRKYITDERCSLEFISQSYQCWISYSKKFSSWRSVNSVFDFLVNNLKQYFKEVQCYEQNLLSNGCQRSYEVK